MTVRTVSIGEVVVLNPKRPTHLNDNGGLIPFIPMAAVHQDGSAPDEEHRSLADVTAGYTYFERGDVLLAKITPCFENGKVAHLDSLSSGFGFGSTEFHVLRAGPDVDSRYLYHAVRGLRFRRAGASSMTGSAGQRRVPSAFVSRYRIPLPHLSEQRRTAAALDRADAILQKRRESSRLLDDFLRSTFLEMFGDPVRNEKGWPIVKLGDVASFLGGGTPSRARPEFYTGTIPWATSKDITGEELLNTQEHVTPEAVEQSATQIVPPGSILIVVKSKILLHRLPVAIARVPVCCNQDLKALRSRDRRFTPIFLARHLRVGQQALLNKARGANTEGLTLEHLRSYEVMMPPVKLLERWEQIEARVASLRSVFGKNLSATTLLFESVVQQSFLDVPQNESAAHPCQH